MLVRLRIILDDIVNGPSPSVSPDLQQRFREAWPQIRTTFGDVDRALAGREKPTDADLNRVALAGPSLQLKVSGFRRAFNRLIRGGAAVFKRNARYLLAWSNTILGSLTDVLPGAEVIKEFKEGV